MQQAVLIVLERTLPLILAAAGIVGCLWLFFALKRDLRGVIQEFIEIAEIHRKGS